MKILNLFAGIGGNRLKWTEATVTAVEFDPDIAEIYQKRFPDDVVVIQDAYRYLEDHLQDGWDLIWASPPCQTHSRQVYRQKIRPIPDFGLYALIWYLQKYAKCSWVVENVKVIDEVIPHTAEIGRHWLWSNIPLPSIDLPKLYHPKTYIGSDGKKHNGGLSDLRYDELMAVHQIKINFTHPKKRSILRNCVDYRIGEHIYQQLKTNTTQEKKTLDGFFS